MTDILHGVFKTDSNGDVYLWTTFKVRDEALRWIGSSRFHEKYDVKKIPATKENIEYLYHE